MKTLEDWYRQINATYLDRNFYRSVESVFAHLVEVSRGLGAAAGTRRKRDLKPEEFLPKTIAWWLALCGRAGVPSITSMLWTKYPGVCPYCRLETHRGNQCKEADPTRREINWDELSKLAAPKQIPNTIAEWQRAFNGIYPRDDQTNHETNVNRLAEEVGELAEAIRALPVEPRYFLSEAPDVFAWLMGFANQFDFDRQVAMQDYGAQLTLAMQREYPGHCRICERQVCKCPPIPLETLGRIAKSIPPTRGASARLFSLQESIELFRQEEVQVEIAGRQFEATRDEIRRLAVDTRAILEALQQQTSWQPSMLVSLYAAVASLDKLAQQGELTQAGIDEIVQVLKRMPSEKRSQAVAFLNNIAASSTFNAITTAMNALAG